ncbi:hypothetical protein P691DRAFT_728379 [Macrolepiota fuliginosa MF-IS2]|uniref:Uncharacterized protein n=1 Tax=Macrolepiota fuliginosa MF-IS2 TaxID=1400762 RepID=A0A9P5XF42_9AGAR|nr:hypothetical protein P691DRAFT_728379 [Macrolepiota fuliginosa MF-IS2]
MTLLAPSAPDQKARNRTRTSSSSLAIVAPPASLALPAPPSPSDTPPASPNHELEWKSSLRNLELRIESYKDRAKEGRATERDAEEVASAMEEVGGSHTDPRVRAHWQERAEEFRGGSTGGRAEILEEIGKGFLALLTTPFALVGAVFQAVGGILGGVAAIFKGISRLPRG